MDTGTENTVKIITSVKKTETGKQKNQRRNCMEIKDAGSGWKNKCKLENEETSEMKEWAKWRRGKELKKRRKNKWKR